MKKVLCLLLAVCLLVGGAAGGGKNKNGEGGGFRFPIAAEPASLDPQMAQDDPSVTVLCALFEGLTRLDNSGKAIPAEIKKGVRTESMVQVLEGLSAGDTLITTGTMQLRTGQRVILDSVNE